MAAMVSTADKTHFTHYNS